MSEKMICIKFVNYLKSLIVLNQLNVKYFDFFHIPNGGARKSSIEGYHFKIMGVRPGVADYQFIWSDGTYPEYGFIEFKTPKTYQTEKQKEFQELCKIMNIKYAIAKSDHQGIEILKQWRVLKP